MFLQYFYDKALAHASYLVGCQQTGEAVIVDPGRDIEQYLKVAKQEKLKIIAIAETHIHADYVSGARQLAHLTGAKLYVSDEGPADWKYHYAASYDNQLLRDGDSFSIGNLEFLVMHTPGHTPESISFLLTDRGGGANEPIGIFTGDFVFVGSIGRPDLLEKAAGIANTAEPGARDLFQSLQRFVELPDFLQVWPTHGAGSPCGKDLGAIPSSTVGYEKRFNPALQIHNEDAFVDYILAAQPEAPQYFALMKQVNKDGPSILKSTDFPIQLNPQQLPELVRSGQVIDTRIAADFASSYVSDTINIQPKYLASVGGTLIDYDQPLYLISTSEDLPEVVRILHKIGVEKFGGYFDAAEIASLGLNDASIPDLTPEQVFTDFSRNSVEMIDIRGRVENIDNSIPGASHEFLGTLPQQLHQLDPSKTYVFQCRTGGRSVVAASIAKRAGIDKVVNLKGGIVAWSKSGYPTTSHVAELIETNP